MVKAMLHKWDADEHRGHPAGPRMVTDTRRAGNRSLTGFAYASSLDCVLLYCAKQTTSDVSCRRVEGVREEGSNRFAATPTVTVQGVQHSAPECHCAGGEQMK